MRRGTDKSISGRRAAIHVVEDDVTLPVYSFGYCKNWRKCGNLQVELGNGLCVQCYDKRLSNLEHQQKVK